MKSILRVNHCLTLCLSVLAWSSSSAGLLLVSGPAVAEEKAVLEEIIVTAQKREQSVRDVPMTVTAFNGAELENRGLTDLDHYAKFVPGLIYNGTGIGERHGPDIVIRGVSNSRIFDFETNIATVTTGFVYGDLPAYAFNPELIDVQRVEVLKGPQGTLYGAAAMGGLVKVVPNLPEFKEFSARLQGGLSFFDGYKSGGGNGWNGAMVVNAPISDTLALRASLHTSTEPGYINVHLLSGKNTDVYGPSGLVPWNSGRPDVFGANGQFLKNVNKSDAAGGRLALRFKPNERFDATLAYMYDSKSVDSLPNYEPVVSGSGLGRLTANQFDLQPLFTNYALTSLEASYNFGPATLHSITGSIDRHHSSSADFAGIAYSVLGGNGGPTGVPVPTPAAVTFAIDNRVFSQELRLEGSAKNLFGSGAGLDWTIGGFYQKEDIDAFGGVSVGPAWLTDHQLPLTAPRSGTPMVWQGEYVAKYTNKAFFADLTVHITPLIAVSIGARHATENVDADRTDFGDYFASAPVNGTSTVAEDVSESKTTPRATVTYAASKNVNWYASYSEGFRIGGLNPIGNISTPGCLNALRLFGINDPQSAARFDTDTIKNFEVGMKGAFRDGRLSLNLTAFQVDWANLQTAIQLFSYDSSCGGSFVANAGKARIKGLDAELRALLTDHWTVAVTGQYADGKITEVVKGSPGVLGAPLKSSPKTQATASLDYGFTPRSEWEAMARLDYAYVGQRNLSPSNTPPDPNFQAPGYATVNVRLAANHSGFEYTVFVNNLTNSTPQLDIYTFAGGPGNYTGAFAPGTQRFVTTSAPRTMGISLKRSF